MTTLYLLVTVHLLCDYPLQGDFLAKCKNRRLGLISIPWWLAMASHTGIHSLGVYIVTQSMTLALIEWVLHFGIDVLKCEEKTNILEDQILHILCKVFYVYGQFWFYWSMAALYSAN